MKKLITILLCAVMALSVVAMTGCGDSTFNGNYKEATAEEVAAYAQTVSQDANNATLDYNSGIEVSVKSEMKITDATSTVEENAEIKGKAIAKDNALQMESSFKMSMENSVDATASVSIEGNAYFANDYIYANAKVTSADQTADQKVKVNMPFDVFFDNQVDVQTDLSSILLEVQQYTAMGIANIKYEMETNDNGTKVRISVPQQDFSFDPTPTYSISGSVKAEFVFVYNAQNQIVAVKTVLESSGSTTVEGATMNTVQKQEAIVKPFSGSVSLPADLDTYTEAPDLPW